MKIIFISLLIISCFLNSEAQKSTPQQYIQQYAPLAHKEMNRVGVPVSITLAQGILESESGNSELALKSNNHFGIKCKSNWEGEKVYHNDDAKGECFRKYTTVEQSYIDHSDFLKVNARYGFLFDLDKGDYQGWAKGLKKAGYATNPVYAQKLIEIIEKYNLHLIKDVALVGNIDTSKNNNLIVVENPPTAIKEIASEKVVNEETVDKENTALEAQYGQKVFFINQVKAIKVIKGTSLLAIAEKYNISFNKLLEYNDLDKSQSDIVDKDIVVFLQKKKKHGAVAVHIVKQNETLHQIAQEEGVKLENLLKNNNLTLQHKLKVGQQLFLQTKQTTSK